MWSANDRVVELGCSISSISLSLHVDRRGAMLVGIRGTKYARRQSTSFSRDRWRAGHAKGRVPESHTGFSTGRDMAGDFHQGRQVRWWAWEGHEIT